MQPTEILRFSRSFLFAKKEQHLQHLMVLQVIVILPPSDVMTSGIAEDHWATKCAPLGAWRTY